MRNLTKTRVKEDLVCLIMIVAVSVAGAGQSFTPRFETSSAITYDPHEAFRLPMHVKEQMGRPIVIEAEHARSVILAPGQRVVPSEGAGNGLLLRRIASLTLDFDTLAGGTYTLWLRSRGSSCGPCNEDVNGTSFAGNKVGRVDEPPEQWLWLRGTTRELKPGRNTWRFRGDLLLWGAIVDRMLLTKDALFVPADDDAGPPAMPADGIKSGSLTSAVIDLHGVREWKRISCRAFPSGGMIEWQYKLEGNDMWTTAASGDISGVDPSRPFRIRLILEPSATGVSPLVDTVRVEYEGKPSEGELGPGVRYAFDASGGCTINTKAYGITLAMDGTVASLKLGARELLMTNKTVAGANGLVHYQSHAPLPLSAPSLTAENTLALYGDDDAALFSFAEDKLSVGFAVGHRSEYCFNLRPDLDVDRIVERDTGRIAKPGETANSAPQIFFKDGASICLVPSNRRIPAIVRSPPKADGVIVAAFTMNVANPVTGVLEFSTMPSPAEVMQMDITCSKKDHQYRQGETVNIIVDTFLPYSLSYKGTAKLLMSRIYSTPEEEEKHERIQQISIPAGDVHTPVTWDLDLKKPGLYAGDHQIMEDDKVVRSLKFYVLYAPEQMKAEAPADFDAFWKRTMDKLAEIPVAFKRITTRDEKHDYLYSRIEFKSIDGRPAWGNLYEPKQDAKYPAILKLPPVGTKAPGIQPSSDLGFVVLGCDVWGHNPDWPQEKVQAFLKEGGVRYEPRGVSVVSKPEEFWLYYAYCTIARAYDILASHPKVDKNRIYIAGTSQGGGLALAAAGLRPQNAGVLSVVPGLCRIKWQNTDNGAWGPVLPGQDSGSHYATLGVTFADMQRMAEYFETAHLMKNLRSRMAMFVGLQDDHTPPHAAASVFYHSPASLRERMLLVGPWVAHGGTAELGTIIPRWAREDSMDTEASGSGQGNTPSGKKDS